MTRQEGQRRRDDLAARVTELQTQLGSLQPGKRNGRGRLLGDLERAVAELRQVNTWLRTHPSGDSLHQQPQKTETRAETVTPLPPPESVCRCSRNVLGEHLRAGVAFYCQDCGHDWSVDTVNAVKESRQKRPVVRLTANQ